MVIESDEGTIRVRLEIDEKIDEFCKKHIQSNRQKLTIISDDYISIQSILSNKRGAQHGAPLSSYASIRSKSFSGVEIGVK